MQDEDELSPQRDAYREHMRALTTARQAAERAHIAQSRDPATRQDAARAFEEEMARIAAEHQAWLREHGMAPDARGKRRPKRLPVDDQAWACPMPASSVAHASCGAGAPDWSLAISRAPAARCWRLIQPTSFANGRLAE